MELKGIDEKVVEKVGTEGYFTREKKGETNGEEAFFKQGEKPEVSSLERSFWDKGSADWCLTVEEKGCECACERPKGR